MVVLAGGYQALEPLVQLHVETIKIAQQVYFTNSMLYSIKKIPALKLVFLDSLIESNEQTD